jgi:hypothetical protein
VGVARGQFKTFSKDTLGGVAFHAVTALVALYLFFKAMAA